METLLVIQRAPTRSLLRLNKVENYRIFQQTFFVNRILFKNHFAFFKNILLSSNFLILTLFDHFCSALSLFRPNTDIEIHTCLFRIQPTFQDGKHIDKDDR